MIDRATRTLLLDLIRSESRSLLAYLKEADPLITPEEQPVLDQLLTLGRTEQEVISRIAHYLQKHYVSIPPLGTFPLAFTTMNFISLDYFVPLLIAHETRRIDEVEGQLTQVHDPHSRLLVQEIIDTKRRHVQTLEGIRRQTATGEQAAVA